jgi:hypothetical protein
MVCPLFFGLKVELMKGRMGQLGKIQHINTKAYLEAARHVMVEYGEYTDAEIDVLCK